MRLPSEFRVNFGDSLPNRSILLLRMKEVKKMLTHKNLKARALERQDVKAEYDRLEEEFKTSKPTRIAKKQANG